MTEKLDEFNTKVEILKNIYKDVFIELNKKIEENKKALEEEIEFDGYKIRLEDMPEYIEPELMDEFILFDLITQ